MAEFNLFSGPTAERLEQKGDALVKEKIADLSFDAGIHDTATLELYLALAHEQAQRSFAYYTKVGRIYQSLGNSTEARRFLALADRMPPT